MSNKATFNYLNLRKFKDYDFSYNHERRQDYYFDTLLYKLVNRFKYSNCPESLRPELMEAQLILNGTVGIAKGTNGLTSYVGTYAGDLDDYGIGTNYVGATAINSFDNKIGKDVVVGINTTMRNSNWFFLDRYARMLGLVDESLVIQLLASRDTPVIEVSSDIEKKQYLEAQKKRYRGELAVMVKESSIDDITGATKPKASNVLEPNNSGIVETLDNLNSFHDDLMKRFFLEAGINISSKDKKAQLTVSEVDSYDNYSIINVLDELECRKKMIEEVNNLFGSEITVELSEAYQNAVDDVLAEEPAEAPAEAPAEVETEEEKGSDDND